MAKKKLTQEKALEILSDGRVHGKRLTRKQKKFFGAVAGGAEPYKAENGIEGTMGGLTNKGFNFNPAWGGAWKNGGWLDKYADGGNLQPPMSGALQPAIPMAQFGLKYTYLEPNDPKLPRVGPSSELAGSVGGENGKPAYLIPSMKYGRMQVDPLFEFKRTGEHLGGPFKTWQEAEAWERDVRHPYVEKGQSIPAPYRRWGQFAMGGSLPGSVGFTYARVAGAAPSEGPRAKKTLPSAQNGVEQQNLEQAGDWYKQWYQQRQALPQFQALAQKRLEGIGGGLPQVILKPMEELQKIGAAAQFEKAKSIYPQMDRIYASDPSTVQAYQQKLEQERGKPLEYAADLEVGVSKPVLTHELSHWFDARFPQSMFSKEGSEKYPTGNYLELGKKSPLPRDEQMWISSRMVVGNTPLRTEVNAVLNNLRQAEGLRGDQPTTPEQMQKIIEKYRNLPKDKLAPQTKEGSINSIIRTLIESVGGDPEKLSELNNRIVAAQQEGTPMAQNGMEMKYYQEGLDWKPKTISKNGGWLDKYNEDVPQAQPGILQQKYSVGPMMGDIAQQSGVPTQAQVARQADVKKEAEALKKKQEARARYEAMPKVGPAKQRSYSEQVQAEEQRRILNEAYAAQNPEVTVDDSGNIVPSGYGRFIQTYGKNLDKFARSLETPLAIESAVALAPLVGRGLATGARAAGEYLTTQTPLRSAYKLNPSALNLERKIAEENLEARQIFGEEAYENFLKYGPSTRPGVSELQQMKDFINLPETAVKIGKTNERMQLMGLSGQYEVPYFSKGSLWYQGPSKKYMLEQGPERIIIPKKTSNLEFHPAGEQDVILEPEKYLPESVDIFAGRRRVLLPSPSRRAYDPANFEVYEGKPHWWKGYRPVKFDDGGVVKDDMGYWNPANRGKVVEISSPYITMKGVDQPLIGVSNTGDVQYMEPGNDYEFDGTSVREYPVAAQGVSVNKADEYPLEKLDNLLNFTNYNKPKAKNGWLEKYK